MDGDTLVAPVVELTVQVCQQVTQVIPVMKCSGGTSKVLESSYLMIWLGGKKTASIRPVVGWNRSLETHLRPSILALWYAAKMG